VEDYCKEGDERWSLHKMNLVYLLSEQILDSQERLSSMDLLNISCLQQCHYLRRV
jgi:hypothetical protein